MTSGEGRSRRQDSTDADDGDSGFAFLTGLIALGVVLQTGAWLWGHPLAATAALGGAGAVLVALRAALRRTALGPPVRRFLQPLWALVRAGIATRCTLARTRAAASVTGRIEQWAHRPVRQTTPAEPAASYTRRSLDHTLEAFEAATPTRFEEMCRELLERDGFTEAVRVGGAGDLGADVLAADGLGRRVVLQCKRHATPLGSEAVQRFNGTARPVHGAAVPVADRATRSCFQAVIIGSINTHCSSDKSLGYARLSMHRRTSPEPRLARQYSRRSHVRAITVREKRDLTSTEVRTHRRTRSACSSRRPSQTWKKAVRFQLQFGGAAPA